MLLYSIQGWTPLPQLRNDAIRQTNRTLIGSLTQRGKEIQKTLQWFVVPATPTFSTCPPSLRPHHTHLRSSPSNKENPSLHVWPIAISSVHHVLVLGSGGQHPTYHIIITIHLWLVTHPSPKRLKPSPWALASLFDQKKSKEYTIRIFFLIF